MILTKEMKKDFKFMALYSYTGKNQRKMPYSNRIFWNKKYCLQLVEGLLSGQRQKRIQKDFQSGKFRETSL